MEVRTISNRPHCEEIAKKETYILRKNAKIGDELSPVLAYELTR